MCFDCLLAFPPFSNAGARKALSKLSRPNTPAPPDNNDAYGPPLSHALNQEDLPEYDIDKDGTKVTFDGDDALGETDSGVEHFGTDSDAGGSQTADMEINLTSRADDSFVYEQDVEIETSLDTALPLSDNKTSEETKPAVVIPEKEKIEPDGGAIKTPENKDNVVANLEVHLDYDEKDGRLKVSVMKVVGVSTKEQGRFKSYRVRLSLRRKKVQSSKTRIRPADAPEFRELFRFQNLQKTELSISELVFKLNGIGAGKFAKEKLFCSATLNLSAMKAAAKQSFLIPLSSAIGKT